MTNEENDGDRAAAYLEIKDGEIADGVVVADLDDEGEAPISDDDEGEDVEHDGEEPMQEDYQDDSIHAFEAHSEGVYAVAWSPASPDLVATGGGDDRAFIWRVGEDAFLKNQGHAIELSGHTDTITALSFSADGTMLASGGMDGCCRIWNATDGKLIQCLEGPAESIEWVRWHPKGNVVLAGSADFTVWMWMAATGACMQVFTGHSGPVTCGGFSFDGKLVVTGGGENDATLRVWDPRTGECKTMIKGPQFHESGLTCVAMHPESNAAITGSESGTVKIVALENGRVVTDLVGHEENASVEAAVYIPNLPLAATGALDGKLIIWDTTSGTLRAICQHPEGVIRIGVHPTQPLVFTGCLDGSVRCWDVRTGACSHTWQGHEEAVQDLAVSPDGNMVLSGSEDGTARVFSLVQS